MKHDASTYRNHGCRCPACRASHREHAARRRLERAAQRVPVVFPDGVTRMVAAAQPHGDVSTYTNWGCRCTECAAANASHRARYTRKEPTTP